MTTSSIDKRLSKLLPLQQREIQKRRGKEYLTLKRLKVTPAEFRVKLDTILFDCRNMNISLKVARNRIMTMVDIQAESEVIK